MRTVNVYLPVRFPFPAYPLDVCQTAIAPSLVRGTFETLHSRPTGVD